MDFFALASQNLLSPPVLFFVLGLVAAFARSDLALPEAISKALSLYLVMAIGFKGGVQLSEGGDGPIVGLLLSGIILSALLPMISFALLRLTTRVGGLDSAAIAAHYGSISIVTFIAAQDAARAMSMEPGGALVAVAAAMEAPAILTGLILANRYAQPTSGGASSVAASETPRSTPYGKIFMDSLSNGSIVLLVGAFFIGLITGPRGMEQVEPFVVDIFRGVLCLFLLDMGLTAGRGLITQYRGLTPSLIAHGAYMPIIGASTGLIASLLIGLRPVDGAILMTLCASASYIAVPAALRLALPEARASLSLSLSLGITFPFNLIIGIPIYLGVAQAVL
ncbi:MAG: sodium-dependent bicarbonate transport family permease [Alphaproteobacteria bacterium]|nr:sodium-dependent bicarbonate transport family permease [Alphaproteobacteria bacterium]